MGSLDVFFWAVEHGCPLGRPLAPTTTLAPTSKQTEAGDSPPEEEGEIDPLGLGEFKFLCGIKTSFFPSTFLDYLEGKLPRKEDGLVSMCT